MSPFARALAATLDYEGGYVHHPLDRGGATHYGITQRTYDNWRLTTGRPKRSVELIDMSEIEGIYHDYYWEPCGCSQLPERLAVAVFDMAVHSGPWNAKLTLQRALRVKADGVIGPKTIEAANAAPPEAVLAFLKRRGAFLQELINTRPSQVIFLEGWINRLLEQAWRA